MIRCVSSISLLCILAFTISSCTLKEGRVVNANGEPLAGALILLGLYNGTIYPLVTDDDGRFQYPDDPDIDLTKAKVTLDAPGYAQMTANAGQQSEYLLQYDDSPDRDSDGLSDSEELALGTDPGNPDTDFDGLPDGLEARVLYPAAIVTMGVDPLHKDLLIEADWDDRFPETKLTDLAVDLLKKAFRNAPFENPDGRTGMNVIVDRGELGGGAGDSENLSADRQWIFYHAHIRKDAGSLMGYAELGGRNHYLRGDFSGFGPAEGLIETIVWMHELGHNLGLRHGGNDNILCKPNYVSVMNYNPFMTLSFSFSNGGLPDLDENALDESAGVGLGAVDWNNNYTIDPVMVSADIDGHTPINLLQWILNNINPAQLPPDLFYALGPDRCNTPFETPIHRDHNDWPVIESRLDNDLDRLLAKLSTKPVTEITSATPQQPASNPVQGVEDQFEFPPLLLDLVEEHLLEQR